MIKLHPLAFGTGFLLALVLATGCQEEPQTAQAQVAKAEPHAMLSADELSARSEHYGNSTQAWLTDRGGNSDGGFCKARLKLPLATEPAWEYDYSAAEFSPAPARTLVHYDGQLLVAAECPQILSLNSSTGEVIFNQDVYAHSNTDTLEQIPRIYMHPQGLVIGQDNLGRYYAWDLHADGLTRLWLGPALNTGSGFVTDRTLLLSSWEDQLYGFDALTGETLWTYPSASQPGGVVLARDGTEIWWSSEGRLIALDCHEVAQKWSITTTDLLERAVIDEEHALAYVVYGSEYLECRKLADGEVLWSFSWAELYSPAERVQRYDAVFDRLGHSTQGINWTGTNNRIDDMAVLENGLVFGTSSGHVFALDLNGRELWRYAGQAPVTRLVAFDNAILLCALYVRPESFSWERAVFCLDEPDWPRYQRIRSEQHAAQEAAGEGDEEQPVAGNSIVEPQSGLPSQEIFPRFAAISLEDGRELSTFEPELLPASPLIPAGENVVYAEAPWFWAFTGRPERSNRLRILAYPWIEREDT